MLHPTAGTSRVGLGCAIEGIISLMREQGDTVPIPSIEHVTKVLSEIIIAGIRAKRTTHYMPLKVKDKQSSIANRLDCT